MSEVLKLSGKNDEAVWIDHFRGFGAEKRKPNDRKDAGLNILSRER